MENLVKKITNNSEILKSVKDQTLYSAIKFADAVVADAEKNNPDLKRDQIEAIRREAKIFATAELLKCVCSYLKETDNITVTAQRVSCKGVEIDATVERDGMKYVFNTDAIFAGGYNVQRLHIRYIVKTDIKKSGNDTKEIEKKVSKTERLISDLKSERRYLLSYEAEMYESMLTNDQDGLKRAKANIKSIEKKIEKLIEKIKTEI